MLAPKRLAVSAFSLMGDLVLFGAGGFLGQHVLRVLQSRGVAAVCLGRQPARGNRSETCDVRDASRVTELLDSLRPQHVLNCASLSGVGDCFQDAVQARSVNAEFPARLAEWCGQNEARLVHVSTDMVFAGEAPSDGYVAGSDAEPANAYGASKLAGEVAVREANPGALVVRLPLLFGDSFGRGLGASDSLLTAIARGEQLGLFTDEWRTPLAVCDAAAALVELCEGEARGLLHLAGSERVTRFELGELVLAAHGLPADSIRASRRSEATASEPRPRDLSLNSECARATLNCELRGPRAFFA